MGFRLPALNPNKPEHLRKRQTEASRRYRAKHKAKISAANRRIYWVRRERALTLLGGPHCAVCGCDEIKFLEILCQVPGEPVSFDRINDYIWENSYTDIARIRTLIHRLKNKIGINLIENIFEFGYKLKIKK